MALNTQQVFDKVAAHLLTQNERSMKTGVFNDKSGCAYRGVEGLTCAFGCLIPDELYDERMEGYVALHVLDSYPKIKELFSDDSDIPFILSRLQNIHDVFSVQEWHEQLEIVAIAYKLNADVLSNFKKQED